MGGLPTNIGATGPDSSGRSRSRRETPAPLCIDEVPALTQPASVVSSPRARRWRCSSSRRLVWAVRRMPERQCPWRFPDLPIAEGSAAAWKRRWPVRCLSIVAEDRVIALATWRYLAGGQCHEDGVGDYRALYRYRLPRLLPLNGRGQRRRRSGRGGAGPRRG